MKTNIVKAIINMGCIPCPDVKKYYQELGRADNLNSAVLEYIKDCFASTIREKTDASRNRKMSSFFSYTGENPSFAIMNGDIVQVAIVTDKNEQVTYPDNVADVFKYDSASDEFKQADTDDSPRQILYITAVTDGVDKLKALYATYGTVLSAYAQGRTMDNPANLLNPIYTKTDECKWEMMCVVPDSIYQTLHKQNRLELEALVQMGRGVEMETVTICTTDGQQPAKLFKSIR